MKSYAIYPYWRGTGNPQTFNYADFARVKR